MWTPENAYAEFCKNLEELSLLDGKSNEAETRLKVINQIIFAVLGWHTSNVEVEKYCREVGFSDYVFSQNKASSLILEAKKIGVTFVVEGAKFSQDPIPFALLAQESPSAKSALLQAIGYAVIVGSRYVAISNGSQWIFTVTYVDNQPLDDRLVYVFESLDSIKANFRTFWKCFSPEGLATNAVHERFFETRRLPPPPKLSRLIPGYPTPSRRNVYANELAYVLRVLWEAIAREEKSQQFILDCYVPTQTDEHLISYAKTHLALRQREDSKYFDSTVQHTQAVDSALSEGGDKPFVILGDVGHGKSTFLDYLRFNAAANILRDYVQIDLDFLDRPDKASEISSFIYSEIERQILQTLGVDILEDKIVRGALYMEFKRFKESARYKVLSGNAIDQVREEKKFIEENISDRHIYYSKLFRHLKGGQRKSLVIFFDNLDRRSSDIQEEAFLKASAIARDWECAVFVCLRPKTFFDSLKSGVLDSLAPKTFTVGAPDLHLVLKRRFEFARRIAMGEVKRTSVTSSLEDSSVNVNLPSVAEIFACCEFSARKGASAILMLSALSNGDIRLLIELTRKILTSGHFDTKKIIRLIADSRKYSVPDFEAVKTLLFGDYDQFDPSASIFINVFDIFHTDPKEHFIKILLLDYLNRVDGADRSMGYVDEQDLCGYSNSYYFDPATFRRHLDVLVLGKCVEVDDDAFASPRYRITTRGRYHVGGLIRSFQYIDAVIIDTPITDNAIYQQMENTDDINGRLRRTKLFLGYLRNSANVLHDIQGERLLENFFTDADREIAEVESRIAKK